MDDLMELVRRLEEAGAKLDVILPDGLHRYQSTYCRHAAGPDDQLHGQCIEVCKMCSSPCVCPCHRGV
jgi:hypothetical protein